MHDTVVPHKSQWLKHLTRKTTNQRRSEPDKTIRLDQLVQVDAQKLHRNAQVTTEVEVFCHLDNMMLLIVVLK